MESLSPLTPSLLIPIPAKTTFTDTNLPPKRHRFYTDGISRMEIGSTGNIGIGVSAPVHQVGGGRNGQDDRLPDGYVLNFRLCTNCGRNWKRQVDGTSDNNTFTLAKRRIRQYLLRKRQCRHRYGFWHNTGISSARGRAPAYSMEMSVSTPPPLLTPWP